MGGNYIKQPKGLTDKTHEATIGDTKLTVKAVKTEYIVAGSKAETRVIHLPESDDPSLSTGGGYVNSGWVQLTMAPYNFTFVYDVEPTGTWK